MIKAEKIQGKDSNIWIKVKFKRNAIIFDTIRTVKGALYDYNNNVWAIPYIYREDFEKKLGGFLIEWVDEPTPFNGGISETEFSEYPTVPGYSVEYATDGKITNYTGFKLPPYADYQVRGFNAIVEKDFLILADDMGLGKSFMTVTAIEAKKKLGQLNRCLILAKASLLYMWRNEIEKFTDCKAIVYAGTPTQRLKISKELNTTDDWTFLIMSYETYRLSTGTVSGIDDSKPIEALVLDEATKIKNPMSKIGQRVHYLPFKYKYVLTATPLPNSPLDSYNYLLLGNELPPESQVYNPWKRNNEVHTYSDKWWAFLYRYAVYGGRNDREIIGYQNIGELRDAIQSNMLRRTKEEKLKDLPEVTFKNIPLQMLPKQRKMYDAVRKEILEDLVETDLDRVPTLLAKLLRLQQVTGSLEMIGVEKDSSIKLDTLDELLEDLIGVGEKVIIFSKFKTLIDILERKYSKKYGLAIVHGEVPTSALTEGEALTRAKRLDGWDSKSESEQRAILRDLTTSPRQKEVDRFQNDIDCTIFLGSTEACKEGLTLTAASNVIFLDYPYTYSSYSQAYSRAHRIGQKNAVTVYNLMCEGTVDEKVMNIMMTKKSMSEVMIDTKVDVDLKQQTAYEFIRTLI